MFTRNEPSPFSHCSHPGKHSIPDQPSYEHDADSSLRKCELRDYEVCSKMEKDDIKIKIFPNRFRYLRAFHTLKTKHKNSMNKQHKLTNFYVRLIFSTLLKAI
jgi:hypothetical protein